MKDTFSLLAVLLLAACALHSTAHGSEAFIEAETFKSSGGWVVESGASASQASGVALLNGAGGAPDGVATATVSIKDAGHYRVWVRYSSRPNSRGPFHLAALSGERVLGDGLFDATFEGKSASDPFTWKAFDVELPEGEITLRLRKHENKNSPGLSRRVDCLLLTMDDKLVPNHLLYGAQTYVRVTLGDGYDQGTYIHIFADHFHAPWYQHYALGRSGAVAGLAVKGPDLLKSGESTSWCNITPLIFQDSGAMLFCTARHSCADHAGRLNATFEFATAPEEKAIVRMLKLDNKPATVAVFLPPNLLTQENLALLKTDHEIAEATGRLADAQAWPTHGQPLRKFPFFVTANIDNSAFPYDEAVRAREQKTLDYFGFTSNRLRRIGGAWLMKDKSYCNPDVEKMRTSLQGAAAQYRKEGGTLADISFCEVTDEPTGQPLEFAAHDPSYAEHFRAWLRAAGKIPTDLLVNGWDDVRIVTSEQRTEFPALYYYSQKFRTHALGEFMATQGKLAQEAYGGKFPVLANFSDGAVYAANFYSQGVDYFELLDSPEQNAIWGEDWSNGSSTHQCASFNVDLMRAAARERGQVIGHHLVAEAGRRAWDIKLNATSELARGVKILNNFCYGPTWTTHEGGPYWRSHVWQGKTETWMANAALTREVGAAEDLLLTAMPAPAKVAVLYSSSSDIWTVDGNLAYGFDRMHTWLALTHAQMPVDIISEAQAAKGALDGYRVCYLSGPNLSLAAAEKLKLWVQQGGTLWLTAGAAARDEFNRPLQVFDDILPATRGDTIDSQKFVNSGRYLRILKPVDTAKCDGVNAEVLAVKQALTPRQGATVLGRFQNGEPAVVSGPAGQGRIYCAGFLPALAYIKVALDARFALEERAKADATAVSAEEAALLERSSNPWEFPAGIRELILRPVREAAIVGPIQCDVPLVDAVCMPGEKGVLVPLANWTNQPIAKLSLKVAVARPIARIESARFGQVAFTQASPASVELSLPLENNDFLKLYFR